ncbi:MAG: lipopolysaccharide kinase InaA family protein, partial [Planctomycetaceae bacterium]
MRDVSLTSRFVRGASVTRAEDAPCLLVRCEAATWMAVPELVEELFDERGLKLSQWRNSGRAEVVKDGVHRTVYRLQLDAGGFYLKHYKATRFPRRLQNLLRPCRASLEWTAARRIAGLGIPTFEPVAVGYCRPGLVVGDNYLVTREIPNAIPLDDFVLASLGNRSAPSVVRDSIAIELGDLVARLHAGRIVHSDLHAGNILVRIGANGHARLWLIDLHPVRQGSRLSVGSIEHNLSLLNHFFAGMATPSDRLRFFRSYMRTLESVSSTTPLAGTTTTRRSMRALSRRFDAYCANAVWQGLRKADRKWITGNRRLI